MGKKSDALAAEFAAYKVRVREEALRAQRSEGWCDSGLNAALSRLGLPEKRQPVRVRVPVRVSSTSVSEYAIYIEADSVEQARVDLVTDNARFLREIQDQLDLRPGPGWEFSLVEPAATPLSGVPQTGDRSRDLDATWFKPISAPGRYCGQRSERRWTCTRPQGHSADWHVACSSRVVDVWPAARAGEAESDADPSAVPTVGQHLPDRSGTWFEPSGESGGPNQCRERTPDSQWYCTRVRDHAVSEGSPHVAYSRSNGVLTVWTEGGTPRAEAERPVYYEDYDEEDDD